MWLAHKKSQILNFHLSVPKIINDEKPTIVFFSEKGQTDFHQYIKEYDESIKVKFIKECMYILSIQSNAQKWSSVFDEQRMDKIMNEINQKFTKDKVIMMGTHRGAYQALVTIHIKVIQ